MRVENTLFVEKYRPKSLDEMILSDDYRKIFEEFINKKEIPNLLLFGPPGGGKTTIARILIHEIMPDNIDVLFLNGSVTTGVDVQRDLVEEFLSVASISGCNYKIVFIDEAEMLSINAQKALKSITEEFTAYGRFIFTTNDPSKIIDPLHSRFQAFQFNSLNKEFVKYHVFTVLSAEEITYDVEVVEKTINTFYPDVRKILGTIQSRIVNKELIINKEDLNSTELLIVEKVKVMVDRILNGNSASESAIQKIISEEDVDFFNLYRELFKSPDIPPYIKIVVNKYAISHMNAMISEMNFMSFVYETMKIASHVKSLKGK